MACFLPYHSLDYCNKGLIHNHVRIMFYFRLLKETISAQISLKSEFNIRKPSTKVMADPWAILILWFLQFSMQYVQLQLESAHSCFVFLPPCCMPLRHASLLLANLPKYRQKTMKFINSEKATNIWKNPRFVLTLLKDRFCTLFFILGRILGHLCNVLLQNDRNLKQNIADMS